MTTAQSMMLLFLASCLILLGASDAHYTGYYHNDYPSYPYKAYPSYPQSGWPLEHVKDVHGYSGHVFPGYNYPGPYQLYLPKYDGLHGLYPHIPVFWPIPPPHYVNIYNIFRGGYRKQTATAQSTASSSAEDSSMEATSGESSEDVTSSQEVEGASKEHWAPASPSPAPARVAVVTVPVSAPKLVAPKDSPSKLFPPSAPLRDGHAPLRYLGAHKAYETVDHEASLEAVSVESVPTSASDSAKRPAPAASAFVNHGWYPHKAAHL